MSLAPLLNPGWQNKSALRIATHGCPHHLDELVAVSLVHLWADARGVPHEVSFLSREEIAEGLDHYDLAIDIGLVFDPTLGRFDHHQSGPDVVGRSAAGLLFDTVFAEDPRRTYVQPMIHRVDEIDSGGAGTVREPGPADRGAGRVSLSSLLKVFGGFRHDVTASRRCLAVIEPLVRDWFAQAEAYLRAAAVVGHARRVGRGIFLESDEPYGPGLLEYLQERRPDVAFVGFPAAPGRFQVIAVTSADGLPRVHFPVALPGASFVHQRAFLAVFPDAVAAEQSLADWDGVCFGGAG